MLGIQGVTGRRQQEDDPPCKSGMAQAKYLQENWDPEKLWTAQGVGRHGNNDNPL
jgi:hypothetical protein